MSLILAQTDSTGLQESLTVISTAVSIAFLLFALSKARRRIPLRPVFDVIRLAVQVGGVTVMASLSGVQTPIGAIAGAAMVGAAVGFLQGRELKFEVEEGRLWFHRSAFGILIWGSGLVAMQVAGLANRAGVVRIGQAVAWFSIGVTVGMIAGRQNGIQRTRSAAAATAGALALATLGWATALTVEQPVAAQDDDIFDIDVTTQEGYIDFCTRGGSSSPSFGTDCAAAWEYYDRYLRDQADFCFNQNFAGAECQRYFDAIMMSGQTTLEMFTCEGVYSEVPSCLGEDPAPAPDPDPEPEPEPEPAPDPEPDDGEPEPPPPPPEPETVEVPEDIDPDAAPPVAPIPDEGESLLSDTGDGGGGDDGGADETGGSGSGSDTSSGSSGGSTSGEGSSGSGDSGSSGSSSGSESPGTDAADTEPADTARSIPDDDDESALSPLPPIPVDDDEETVTADEALQQAIAGLLAAALIGIITWAEAFQTIDALSGAAPGTAASQYGHMQQQFPDSGSAPAPAGSAPPGTPSTPVDSYLPGGTTTAPPPGDGGSGGAGSGGSNPPMPDWVPQGFDDNAAAGTGTGTGGIDHGPGGSPSWVSDPTAPDDTSAGQGGEGADGSGSTDTDSGLPDWLLDHGPTESFDGESGGGQGDPDVADGGTAGPTEPEPETGDEPSEAESEGEAGSEGGAAPESTGAGIEDWLLDELEREQLDPDGAPPQEVPGPMGAANSRLTDRDGDGAYDHVEYDDDRDGTYDRVERLDEPIPATGSGRSEPDSGSGDGDSPPEGSGGGIEDDLLDALADGPDLGPTPAEPMEVDINGRRIRLTDTNGDGEYDTAEGDSNGDGVFDQRGRMVDGEFVVDEPAPADRSAAARTPDSSGEGAGADETTGGDFGEDESGFGDDGGGAEVPHEPAPLSRQEIDDAWRWGLANGRSVEDIREDLAGLNAARGVDAPIEDPYGIQPRPTSAGEVPLTAGEAAHYADLQQQLGTLDGRRSDLDAQWQELLEQRRRWTSRELNVDLRRMARALEVFELNASFDDQIAAEQEWIRVYKMWRAGDTWASAPDGSSFYDHQFPDRRSFDHAIDTRVARIAEIDSERIAAMEHARDSRVTTERLDDLDRLQDDLMARRRAVDAEMDAIRADLHRYESYGSSRPLPER